MSDFVDLVTGLAWPALIAGGGWHFRSQVKSGVDALQRQLAAGANMKWKDFEFTGVHLASFGKQGVIGYRTEKSDAIALASRDAKYRDQKNLFLTHRVVPTGKLHEHSNLPNFDVLVQLVPHKHYGKLNDVKRVDYYFGKFFGREVSKFGAKFIVENGSDGFAVRVDAYGPTLCEATIYFHDGTTTTCSRYLDMGGTPYVYDPAVTEYDAKIEKSAGLP